MIDNKTLTSLKDWFCRYVSRYRSFDPGQQQNMDLKAKHTERVCEEILDIATSIALTDEQIRLAEVTALFHDIGRFEQYSRYGTFADHKSENHASLGAKVLKEEKVLDLLDKRDRDLILYAVSNHNRAVLPEEASEDCLFFLRLLRDADKLDIWRVVTEYYKDSGGRKNSAIELDLPDSPHISPEVVSDIMAERVVKISSLKTFNDFKLLQIGWVFDLTFRRAFELLRQRGYMRIIRDALPKSAQVDKIFAKVDSYVDLRCRVPG